MLTVVSLLEEPFEVFNLLILVGEAPLRRRRLPRALLDLLLQAADDDRGLGPLQVVVALPIFRRDDAASEMLTC